MRITRIALALGLLATGALAQQATPPPKPNPTISAPPATPSPEIPSLRGKLIYKPIGRGAPAGRVDAGSRGDGEEIASLYVLAPEEVGLTTSAQPSLFWYQTKPAKIPFELSLLKPNQPAPVLRIRRPSAEVSGFQHLDLRAHGVSLEPGTDYQWVVALIRDPESRSRDIISSGWIRLAEGAKTFAAPTACAAHGLWYDAVTALFAQIAARPQDPALKLDRQDLLTQVGLPSFATPASASKRR